jgi:hypothetical protein
MVVAAIAATSIAHFEEVSCHATNVSNSRVDASRGGSNRDHKNVGVDAYLWIDDAAALYNEFQRAGANLLGSPVQRTYGMNAFEVRDLDGYVLCFGQDVPATTTRPS